MEYALSNKDLQKIELNIAKEIKRICEKNSISYFIVGGTLLGAVRHSGFIPWDDDMDIGMTYENYCKFLSAAKVDLQDMYILQEWNDGSDYGYPFAKVKLKGTCVVEKVSRNININRGVWVDIFPYIQVPKRKAKSKMFMFVLQMLSKSFLLKLGYDLNCLTENVFSRILNFFLKNIPLSEKWLSNKFMRLLLTSSNKEENDFYIECDGMFKGNFVFPKNYFDNTVNLKFEDTFFSAPHMYKEYLSDAYGDYLTPPPLCERNKGHSIISVTTLENNKDQ